MVNYICLLIHKQCHLKSYHSDIKYHMPLNIIFSVVQGDGFQYVLAMSHVLTWLSKSNKNRKMSTCNQLDLETLGFQPIMFENHSGHWQELHLCMLCFLFMLLLW